MRSAAFSVLFLAVVLGGSVAMPHALRALFGIESLWPSSVLAVLWAVGWARVLVWGLKRRARLYFSIKTRE